MISVDELVPASRVETIQEVLSGLGSVKSLAAIKEACPSDISYQDIVLVIASVESDS
jgi:hypothetical protein